MSDDTDDVVQFNDAISKDAFGGGVREDEDAEPQERDASFIVRVHEDEQGYRVNIEPHESENVPTWAWFVFAETVLRTADGDGEITYAEPVEDQ